MPTPPYTFSTGLILASEVNANFAKLTECLDLAGGTITGNILPNITNTRSLGSVTQAFAGVFSYLFKLIDVDASHVLSLAAGSNLTADRTLTITTGDANRTLTLTADSTVGGTAYVAGGTDVALADGGTGATLADPNADRILFWDDSAGQMTWLTAGTNLTITGTTISSTDTVGLTITGTDERAIRMNGTNNIQDSAVIIDDGGNVGGIASLTITGFFVGGGASTIVLATGNNNNVALSNSVLFPIDATAGSCVITGLTNGTNGREIILANVGASGNFTLAGEDANSTATNRIVVTSGNITPGQFMRLVYSSAVGGGRWLTAV